MKNKTWKYLGFLAIPIVLVAFYLPSTKIEDVNKDELLIQLVKQSLSSNHFQEHELNDEFSKSAFSLYMENLDFGKRFFIASDVATLKKHESQIDDQLLENSPQLFLEASALLDKRTLEAKTYYVDILSKPFDFKQSESLETDTKKVEFAKNEAELKEYWRKMLKYRVMTRVAGVVETQEKEKEKNKDAKTKTFEEIESQARKEEQKTWDEYFIQMSEIERTEKMGLFLNAIASVYDPHTTYYAPRLKERFDESFSGKFEGIGATLREKDGSIMVENIMPGSAAWRQGDLKKDFAILKVAQGAAEPVEITGMRLTNAVKLIRGKKGSEVRLTVKKLDGSLGVISIIRDVVIIEETFVKSAILKDNDGKKIGYIELPSFYADFSNTGGRNCGDDVRKELEKLKAEQVDGVVLDLRNNGGGSLDDVVQMVGLFIESGPVVQVKGRKGSPIVREDRDPSIVYNGALAVMVNSYSASASEILAGAIQDYKRGVIVGNTSTFGKGTVQAMMDLDRYVSNAQKDIKPLGSLTLTIQKFYRINGTTNQLKGVVPDIHLPDELSYLKIGEKEEKFPLAWDEISPLSYKQWKENERKFSKAREKSKTRVEKSKAFSLVQESALWLQKQREKTVVTLNLEQYRAELAKRREETKRFEEVEKLVDLIEVETPNADKAFINADSSRISRYANFHKEIKKDFQLIETMRIVKDLN